MARLFQRFSWRPTKTQVVAAALIALGLALTNISWGYVFIVGFGVLGPGLLRELGWLRDQDEFQRQAARRAGYHAFLATSFLAFFLVGLLRTREYGPNQTEPIVLLLLVVLWFTWVLSSMLAYWGSRRMARIILVTFGIFWLIFSVADSLASFRMFFKASLVGVPFFVLAYAAGRWPKVAGILLIVAAGYFFHLFKLQRIFGPEPFTRGNPEVIVLFIGPLLASGLALLFGGRGGEEKGEESGKEEVI